MNIALIGAPGSGKSALAEAVAARLREHDPTCGCQDRTVALVDDYIPEVEEKVHMALGHFGDYLGNLYVALDRYAKERNARLHNDWTITCGTLLETAVYLAMHLVALGESLNEEEKAEAGPRIDAVLRIFAVLYNDIFKYDYAFYLPPREIDQDTAYMDQQLRAGLEGFKLIPVKRLDDPERQVEDVLEALSEVQSA